MVSVDISEIIGYMAKRGYNKTTLAKELEISVVTLRNYFNNPKKMPHGIICRLVEVLQIPDNVAKRIFFGEKLS